MNDCIHCVHYVNNKCNGGHNYDGTVRTALNSNIEIECKQFKER